VDAGYWARHLRRTIRFCDGLETLLKEGGSIFVEVGPGRTLGTFVEQHKEKKTGHKVVNLVRHPQEEVSDDYFLSRAIGQMWLYGTTIDWPEFYPGEKRYRIPLPTYPFEKKRYRLSENRFNKLADLLFRTEKKESPANLSSIETPGQGPEDEPEGEYEHGSFPEIAPDEYAEESEYAAPRDELEARIIRVWQEFLGFERISIHDNFFRLNGDSLTATQVISRVNDIYAVEVSIKDFFEEPTAAHLAKVVKKLLIEKIKNLPPEEKKRLAAQG
jgi:acyl transferase domain-containing protein